MLYLLICGLTNVVVKGLMSEYLNEEELGYREIFKKNYFILTLEKVPYYVFRLKCEYIDIIYICMSKQLDLKNCFEFTVLEVTAPSLFVTLRIWFLLTF